MAKLKIPCFSEHCFPIDIYFCANELQWHSLLKDRGISDEPYPTSHAQCTSFAHPEQLDVCIITMSELAETKSSIEVMGLLVHELTHVKQHTELAMYQRNSGVSQTGRLDTETEAYLMQKLLMWVISAFADSGRKFADA